MLMLRVLKRREVVSPVSVELLHFFTGFSLVVCGGISYFTEGLGMMLSWSIFGAMYISMSDIGEDEMKKNKRLSRRHLTRVIFAYAGAFLSIALLGHSVMAFI